MDGEYEREGGSRERGGQRERKRKREEGKDKEKTKITWERWRAHGRERSLWGGEVIMRGRLAKERNDTLDYRSGERRRKRGERKKNR